MTTLTRLTRTPVAGRSPSRHFHSQSCGCSSLFVASDAPTMCGLPGFACELASAVDGPTAEQGSAILSLRNGSPPLESPKVIHELDLSQKNAYLRAARFCNNTPYGIVSIQHDSGFYTRDNEEDVVAFAEALQRPLVTTLHSLALRPDRRGVAVVRALGRASARVVVTTRSAVHVLRYIYGVPPEKVTYIPHGVPEMICSRSELRALRANIAGSPMLLTAGHIKPNKGLQDVIDAMPAVLKKHPQAVYVIAGQVHPDIPEVEGRRFLYELEEKAEQLGVAEHVMFENRPLSPAELQRYLAVCDVYVSPYISKDQVTDCVLDFALAAGRPVVATPYAHAEEMGCHGAVLLAEFRDSNSLACRILQLLGSADLRAEVQGRARQMGAQMRWNVVGRQYESLFRTIATRA